MNRIVSPWTPGGRVRAIPSKSAAHRLLLCAALSDRPASLACPALNDDIRATAGCIRALGGDVTYTDGLLRVTPIGAPCTARVTLDCGESGSTLRFLLPIAAALGQSAAFTGAGRLSQRPLEPLYGLLCTHGCRLSPEGAFPLLLDGKLPAGDYEIDGSVSSQFISGLLMALTAGGGGSVTVTGTFASAPYVALTVSTLRRAGVTVRQEGRRLTVSGRCRLPDGAVEGDWSAAAFWFAAGALGAPQTEGLRVTGLDPASPQGDRAILDLLEGMGARVTRFADGAAVQPPASGPLRGIEIDAAQIPDLVPVLAVTAACAHGETRIIHVERLRAKESDRLETTAALLRALGGTAEVTADGLRITGRRTLTGGTAEGANDHRIVMAAAVAAVRCADPVTILGAEACAKSYPSFFDDLAALGACIREE